MNIALPLHISGAVITLILVTLAAIQLLRRSAKRDGLVRALALAAMFQLLTGAWLVAATPGASLVAACLNGLAYLSVVGAAAFMLKRVPA